jgi:hypothetical protein
MAAVGIALVLRRRQTAPLLLVGYMALHLILTSVAPLHWHRWAIQVLPVLALCSGYGLQTAANRFALRPLVAIVIVGLASVQPISQVLVWDMQQAQTSSRVLGREWILGNLPAGTSLVEEWYGPPLEGTPFPFRIQFSLTEQPIERYALTNWPVVVASSAVYERYFAEADRYPGQVAFYNDLFTRFQLLQQFRVTTLWYNELTWLGGGECNCALHPTRGPVVIRIYRVS